MLTSPPETPKRDHSERAHFFVVEDLERFPSAVHELGTGKVRDLSDSVSFYLPVAMKLKEIIRSNGD